MKQALIFIAFLVCCQIELAQQAMAQESAPSGASDTARAKSALGSLPLSELMKRVDANDPAAQNELALRYRYGGLSVDKDRDKALEWFRKAARNGSAKACFNLGVVYYNGDGVPENLDTACTWFLIGAESGDPSATAALARSQNESSQRRMAMCETAAGDIYVTGQSYPQNYATAVKLYRQAAERNFGPAEERLAELYEKGLGVPADTQAYYDHLQRAADLGQAPAAYSLGRIYQTGSIGNKDPKLALKWLEKSAMMQFPPATMTLAAMYNTGDGVKQDHKKALMWYLLAVHFGLGDAQGNVQTLSTELTQKQVHDAKSDADNYLRHMGGGLVLKQP